MHVQRVADRRSKSFDEAKRPFDWRSGPIDDTDKGWLAAGMPGSPTRPKSSGGAKVQGVVETQRRTDDQINLAKDGDPANMVNFCRAWIDTSKLREKLGYR